MKKNKSLLDLALNHLWGSEPRTANDKAFREAEQERQGYWQQNEGRAGLGSHRALQAAGTRQRSKMHLWRAGLVKPPMFHRFKTHDCSLVKEGKRGVFALSLLSNGEDSSNGVCARLCVHGCAVCSVHIYGRKQ